MEVDVRTDALDDRNMVVDFSDIKRIVKGWIDTALSETTSIRPIAAATASAVICPFSAARPSILPMKSTASWVCLALRS